MAAESGTFVQTKFDRSGVDLQSDLLTGLLILNKPVAVTTWDIQDILRISCC